MSSVEAVNPAGGEALAVPLKLIAPPPVAPPAVLPENVLFSTTIDPPPGMFTAPPTPVLALLSMELLRTARKPAPVNAIAPPSALAELPEIDTSSSETVGDVPPIDSAGAPPVKVAPMSVNVPVAEVTRPKV